MVVELQASHERIDLSNEELTASNEELQSANEELKSVNEDLYALNRELHAKNEELAALTRDYDHLLDSTDIGTVFLDAQLCLRRISPGSRTTWLCGPQTLGGPWPISTIGWGARGLSGRSAALRAHGCTHRNRGAPAQWALGVPTHAALQGRGQEHLAWCCCWTDISEVKRIQHLADQLASDRSRLMAIMDALPDGCASPTRATPSRYQPYTWEFGPVQGRKCYEYFHGRQSTCDWCRNADVYAGKTVNWEWTNAQGQSYERSTCRCTTPTAASASWAYPQNVTAPMEQRRRMEQVARLAHVGHWEWTVASGELRWSDETAVLWLCAGAVTPSFDLFCSMSIRWIRRGACCRAKVAR
jgi:hypothetical protein